MGMSAREISRTRGIASASVKKVMEAAGAAGLTWDDVRSMNEPEVYDPRPAPVVGRAQVPVPADAARGHESKASGAAPFQVSNRVIL